MTALKVLQLPSAGSDGWTSLPPATTVVCDGRGLHSAATAEWILAATLAQLRALPAFRAAQLDGSWAPRPSTELRGKRALLIGAGSVGSAVVRLLAPFEVDLTVVARTARPDKGVRAVSDLPSLLPRAEVVIVVVPLTTSTRHLVDRAFLAALPDGALVVNAARGPVVDTVALVDELASGRLRAALDVTDPEPLPSGHSLWRTPNTLITPHVAAVTDQLLDRVYRFVGAQVNRYRAGEPLLNRVSR